MYYEISGGKKLFGEVSVYGAKNAVLPLLASSVLADAPLCIENCRPLGDVETMCQILRSLGVEIIWKGHKIAAYPQGLCSCEIPQFLGSKIRASVLLMGALLGKNKVAKLPLPGGCSIGKRPIDIHLDGFAKLGAKFDCSNDVLVADGRKMHGNKVELSFPSVGATENLLLGSVLTKGETKLTNCAIEPEVVQLEQALVQMGAKIDGIGTSCLTIEGVDSLNGATVTAVGDRIVAATYLLAVAGTGGKVKVTGVESKHCAFLLNLLQKAGCVVSCDDGIVIESDKLDGLGRVETAPYPGFPTDVQSLLLSLACVCDGYTEIKEGLFENRLEHNARQLQRLGAKISVSGNVAKISGGTLSGATVDANDLRGGAGLVLAGLFAKGITRVNNVHHVERGYFDLIGALKDLGADARLTN